jgi:hypothetical protein
MKDPSYSIRVAVANVLDGITWSGTPVPIYDDMAADDAPAIRIILQEINGGGPPSSKCGFGGDWSHVIKITHIFPGTSRIKKDALDYIGNEILTRLVPFYSSLDIGMDFVIWKVQGSVIGNQSYEDGANKYVDKNLRIIYSITEN